MELEIWVDRQVCMGAGQCVHAAPGVFDQDERAISRVMDPGGESIEKIARAVTTCPVEAITLRVGDAVLGARDLRIWSGDIDADDPVVAQLVRLADDHHELLEVATRPSSEARSHRSSMLPAMIADHLLAEQKVFDQMASLVPSAVVDVFRKGHSKILEVLEMPESQRGEFVDLEAVVADRVAAEEAVLFPAVLSAIGAQRSAGHLTTR